MFVKLFGASERITENLEREFPCTHAQKALLSVHSGPGTVLGAKGTLLFLSGFTGAGP